MPRFRLIRDGRGDARQFRVVVEPKQQRAILIVPEVQLTFTGAGGLAFTWSEAATGQELFTGAGDLAFTWSIAATGGTPIPITGTADLAFGWGIAAAAVAEIREEPFAADFWVAPHFGEGKLAWGWGIRGDSFANPLQPVAGAGALRFEFAIAADLTLDVNEIAIGLEDALLLLGIGELDSV